MVVSERFCDVGGGITLCYETYGDPADPPVLLVMGLGAQMVAWQEDFCLELAERGLYVVRFDNRDIGRSTHLQGPPPSLVELLRYSVASTRYTLADMAQDIVGLMDQLEIDSAHVVGASMGGMIAQTLTADHPTRVRSLVSMMSSTGARRVGRPALSSYAIFLRKAPREREAFIEHAEGLFAKIGSRGIPQDTDGVRGIAALSFDRELDRTGSGRQLAAIIASGDRTPELERIAVPTLVIHGTVDPLISPSGGRATARAIPGAQLMMIEGMGHDLPRVLWPRLIDAFVAHAAEADRPIESPAAIQG
jgi:pimeloyl-ACP methyl ester carboxylesterase